MKSYRFIIRYGGFRIDHTFKSENDDEARKYIIKELLDGRGSWFEELGTTPSKMFITYEEVNVAK